MKIFWSWQDDHPSSVNRAFVREALEEAAAGVSKELGLTEAERPEIDQDTKGSPGWVEISREILDKIDACAIFVADVTPIAESPRKKKLPNPNVAFELGYALKAIGKERVILVCNATFYGAKPEELPFDMRHRRGPVVYDLPMGADAKKRESQHSKLVATLIDALILNLGEAISKKDATVEFQLHPARPGDPSTWLPMGAQIEHRDFYGEGGETRLPIEEGPRAYMRVIPAGWAEGKKPSRLKIHEAHENYSLWPLGRWVVVDGGLNELGALKVAKLGQPPVVYSAAQWFDTSGEIWGFDTRVTEMRGDQRVIFYSSAIARSATFLKRALTVLRHHGAQPPFRVEAGLSGLADVYWSEQSGGAVRSLDSQVVVVQVDRFWGAKKQAEFLTHFYNRIRDAFGKPHVSEAEIQVLVDGTPD